jgi:8-oxo-dGTP pyrophosphatase MutT (NUDIX family)
VIRAGIVLCTEQGIAAIERVREGRTYYVLPGGQVEEDENPVEAAVREAYEELGVIVKIRGLVAVVHFGLSTQLYYRTEILNGDFGSGTGEEMSSPAESESGSYRAVWIEPRQLAVQDVRPKLIAAALETAPDLDRLLDAWEKTPAAFEEV